MSVTPTKLIGQDVRRLEADRFVQGTIEYTADYAPSGLHHIAIVRSPHARARIKSIDLSPALRMPGVLFAVDGKQVAAETDPTPSRFSRDRFPGPIDTYCLATEFVRFAGHGVAAVVASSHAAARAAADRVVVEYELLDPVLDCEAGLLAEAPRVHEGWPSNRLMRDHIKSGDVDAALAECDFIATGEIRFGSSTSAPMETRCYFASWDERAGKLVVRGTLQMPHPSRWAIAQSLRLKESQIQVLAPRAGGAFGLKMVGHPEEVLVAFLARKLGVTVRYLESREDCFLARAREQVHRFEIGATRSGTIVAFRNRYIADIGAVGAGGGWAMGLVTGGVFPTVYNIQSCEVVADIVVTNKSPWQGVRGFGKEVANLVMERAIDALAAKSGINAIELRRKNLVKKHELPRKLPSSLNVDSGDYEGALERLITMFDIKGWHEKKRAQSRAKIGVSVAFELTPEGAAFPGSLPNGFETVTVRVEPSGEVVVLTSVTSPGGGNETGIAQLVGQELGVNPSQISVQQGDTDVTPFGGGNASSRGLLYGGPAASFAARDVREKLSACAAVLLQTEPSDVRWQDGNAYSVKNPSASVSMPTVAFAIYTNAFTVADKVELPLQATRSYKTENVRHVPDESGRTASYPSFPYAVHAAAVEVDTETGIVKVLDYAAVHDCGVVINPSLVDGQFRGAIVMGIGAALWEEIKLKENGERLTDRFKNYLMPRSLDLPQIRTGHLETPSPFHPLGMKGGGECGLSGAYAVITNAVHDAFDGRLSLCAVPASPQRIIEGLADVA